jgi:rRNA maturation endonuclease Nob1
MAVFFKASIERLVHFCCTVCSKWWSIADAPDRDHWFCPWCGVKLEAEVEATRRRPNKIIDGLA